MRGFGLCVLVFGVLGACATQANAASPQDPAAYPSCVGRTVTATESDAAHKIYLAGRVQYDDSNWDAAISQFREAYRRDCTKHELLIILSRAYEAKGQRPEAVRALQTYLDRAPADAPDLPALRKRLGNIKAQVAKDEEEARKTAASAPPPATTPAQAEAPAAATAPVAEPPPANVRTHTVMPWVVVGIGAAALATGLVVLGVAPERPSNCSPQTNVCSFRDPSINRSNATPEQFAQNAKDSDQANQSVSMNLAGTVTAIAGGALVLGGLAWHFLEPTGPVESHATVKTPRLSPTLGMHSAGLSLSGSF